MVQFGQNVGPCYLSVFGYVSNIKSKKMVKLNLTRKNRNLLEIFTIVWNVLRANLPASVVKACEDAMDNVGLSNMGTEKDPSGEL